MSRSRVAELALLGCAISAIVGSIVVIVVLAGEAAVFVRGVPLGELFGDTVWRPADPDPRFGIWPLVTGTLLTTGIAIGFALPIGLLAAIYLSELASPVARARLKPAIELLAGIPTVVYAVFAVVVVIPALQTVVAGLAPFNALGAGLVVGLMIVPTITSIAEDSIHAVPPGLREAAYALGARPTATILRVVLPSAASGIGAGVLLAVSRAAGETLIVGLAAGHAPTLTLDPRVPIETLTGYLARAATGDAAPGTAPYEAMFAVGAGLFTVTFIANLIGNRMARRLRARALR